MSEGQKLIVSIRIIPKLVRSLVTHTFCLYYPRTILVLQTNNLNCSKYIPYLLNLKIHSIWNGNEQSQQQLGEAYDPIF